jgi:hypothetical protein
MGCQFLAGVRYLDLQERLLIFTDDDVLTAGAPDPLTAANYIYRTHDRIVAPQLGVELSQPIWSWLGFSAVAKGAWGVNFLHTDTRLIRQDGLVGFDSSRNTTIFSQMYEVGVFLDVYLGSCCHVRGGYRGLWILDVPSAVSQVDFNLQHVNGTENDNGSIFFHGPSASVEIVF